MIKIYRKKQKLLSEGKTTTYLKYAVGEILLVVIGILIALQINNWNEARKLHKASQYYYNQILEDLETDKRHIESTIKQIDSSIKNYNIYLEMFKVPNLPVEVVGQNLVKIRINPTVFYPKTTAIKSLLGSGEIKILDAQIRNKLTSYNANKELIRTLYETARNLYLDIFKEVYRDGIGLEARLVNQKELAKVVFDEQRNQEMYIKLDAYHYFKNDTEKWFIDDLKALLKQVDSAAILIKSKIES
jgi:predicted regulator of amino acid metabolism with ACT domain